MCRQKGATILCTLKTAYFNRPTAFKVLDMPLVVWKDAAQEWQVLRDVCPHRLAQLSEGRVTEAGNLVRERSGKQAKVRSERVFVFALSLPSLFLYYDRSVHIMAGPSPAEAPACLSRNFQGTLLTQLFLHRVLVQLPSKRRSCKALCGCSCASRTARSRSLRRRLPWCVAHSRRVSPFGYVLKALLLQPELDEKGFVCTDVARILPYECVVDALAVNETSFLAPPLLFPADARPCSYTTLLENVLDVSHLPYSA